MKEPTSVPQSPSRTTEQERVVAGAVLKTADLFGLQRQELADVIGVANATVSKFKHGRGLKVGSAAYQTALALIRIYRSLGSIVGDNPAYLRGWMDSPNRDLGGTPREMIQRQQGLYDVLSYLDTARARL